MTINLLCFISEVVDVSFGLGDKVVNSAPPIYFFELPGISANGNEVINGNII